MMTAIYVVLAILLLGVIVMVHELGHFVVGRLCGIGVEEFSIGMGPKIFGWKKKDIQYSIRAIPLGGYVHFTGEDEDNPKENAFNNHPVWKRFLTVAAGASMNFVLAFAAIFVLFTLYGYMMVNVPEFYQVEPGTPAAEAGLLAGDKVISVDGVEISYDEAGFDEMYAMFSARTDATPLEIGIDRGGEVFNVSVSKAQTAEGAWQLGVVLGARERVTPGIALQASWEAFCGMSTMMIDFLKGLVFRGEGADQVQSVVGVIGEASGLMKQGFDMVLNMLATISMNLGIMNLLPLPALDGGRLVFLIIEAIRRKPLPPEKEGMVHGIGMIALLILMAVLVFSDIMKMIA